MNAFRSFVSFAWLALALGTSVQATTISGRVIGVFEAGDLDHTTVVNSPDGDASFRSGVAVGQSFQSGVVFDSQSFTGISEGEKVSVGNFAYYNGITRIGTSSSTAALDLYLQLSDPQLGRVHLATLNFGIDATINSPSTLVADKFTVDYQQPAELLLGNQWFNFSLSGLDSSTTVAENSSVDVGSLSLWFGPVVPVADNGVSLLFLAMGILALGIYANPGILSRARNCVV